MNTLLNIKKAARRCGVDPVTLRNWEKAKKVAPIYTPGGHRRYTEEMLDALMQKKEKA